MVLETPQRTQTSAGPERLRSAPQIASAPAWSLARFLSCPALLRLRDEKARRSPCPTGPGSLKKTKAEPRGGSAPDVWLRPFDNEGDGDGSKASISRLSVLLSINLSEQENLDPVYAQTPHESMTTYWWVVLHL